MSASNLTGILAPREYWEKKGRVSCDSMGRVIYSKLFFKYLEKSHSDRVAIELGCVPGLYLAYVCKNFGYFPEGLDFVEDADEITGNTLKNFGIEKYKIYVRDFMEWQPDKKYDLVLSLGFIEHFQNPDEILKKHIDILKKGGKIILDVPNFTNGQKFLHYYLDRENLARHNISVMSKSYFKSIAERFSLKIEYIGYHGGLFLFWDENETPTKTQKVSLWILEEMGKVTCRIGLSNRYFSPYLIMIAQKT